MNKQVPFPYLLILIFLSSCNLNKEPEKLSDIPTDDIYPEYRVTGQEGYDKLTVLVQFRYGDADGETILLEEPARVELDGEAFPADSSRRTGIFYELHKPIATFAGKHSIVFTGFDKQQQTEEFEFKPLNLLTVIPDTLRRSNLDLELEGAGDSVRVLVTDTAFYSEGINRMDSVINGRLVLTQFDLESLTDGPVLLELIVEKESPLKNRNGEMGRLLITYSLRRQFFLKD